MLHDQFLARGVSEDNIPARIDAIMAKVQPDKLRMHVAEEHMKQWSSIKHLANEAKVRLITVDELRKISVSKKAERSETQSTASTSRPQRVLPRPLRSSLTCLKSKSIFRTSELLARLLPCCHLSIWS